MTPEKTRAGVHAAFARTIDREVQYIRDDQPIVALGISSNLMVDLLVSLEHKFEVAIPEERLYQCGTVGDVCVLLEELQHRQVQ